MKKKHLSRTTGVGERMVPVVFWAFVLLGLFQMMPAASFLRQRGKSSPVGGDRYVS